MSVIVFLEITDGILVTTVYGISIQILKKLQEHPYFKSPDIKGGFKNNSPVELIDIFPTICKIAGIPAPDYLDGISLFPILNRTRKI